ncbi:oligosaccharide flippase family protein [Paenibacillus chitinolyticus]|uniref:lipopolysaccharide biosynthesis protein n=1 Tax=Paenibacillus chitinolyticus TaxID=79263 RepID=UPI002DB63D58|nr:oligosaccharide flippase family protein [Paenibacillus chitinolyticus]MEC0247484.1 oligosaccharide flippase family protein [Paenibacillus chitinolyticus]
MDSKSDIKAHGPTKSLSLKLNFSWTFAGNLFYAICQWAMLSVMAKLGTAEMVGQFSLGLAITAPVFMFTNLQLRGILASDRKDEYTYGQYFGLRLIATLLAFLIIVGISLLGPYNWETAAVIILIGLAKSAEAMSEIAFGLMQKHERMDRISLSLIAKGIISLLLLTILLWLTKDIILGMISFALSAILLFFTYDLTNSRNYDCTKIILNPRQLRKLIKTSLPMGIVMLLISLNTNMPRYFIEHGMGTDKLGYFSAISYMMMAGTTVVSALGQSAVPRFAGYYADAKRVLFRRLMIKLVMIGTSLGIAGVAIVLIFGKEILAIIYKPEYASYQNVFILIMIGAGISYVSSFLGYGLTSARLFSVQPYIFLVVCLTTLLASYWLIPQWGLEGAAMAIIVGNVVNLAACMAANSFILGRLKGSQEVRKVNEAN